MFAAVAAASALLLTGCAAGQISQTAQQEAAIDGANGDVGDLGVRNALIATPAGSLIPTGSELPMQLVLSNKGQSDDTLTAVSSPAAEAWSGEIAVPAGSTVQITSESDDTVTLPGLKNTLCFGQSVPFTFTFAQAGALTVRIPIQNPPERTGTRETIAILPPHPTPVWETGAHAAEHAAEESGSAEAAPSAGASDSPLNCNSVLPSGQ